MPQVIETRITRVGTKNKPIVTALTPKVIVDFDEIGTAIPSNKQWRELCKQWQISPNQSLVVIEAHSVFCSARLAWLLQQSGFTKVSMETLQATKQLNMQDNEPFELPLLDQLKVNSLLTHEVLVKKWQAGIQIIDVRSPARFSGEEPDPRHGVRSGHIPGSINIHYPEFLSEQKDRVFKPISELVELFQGYGVDVSKPMIFSCGSGVTACIGAMAASLCKFERVAVYDGSWAQWGSDASLPVTVSC